MLLLDELTEFGQTTLNAPRQSLEGHAVTFSRAQGTVTYTATCNASAP